VLANVGMLVEPIDKVAYDTNNSSIVPNALFSHSDQAGQWQTSIPTGLGSTGWADASPIYCNPRTRARRSRRHFDQRIEPLPDGQQTFAANVPSGSATLLNYGNSARQPDAAIAHVRQWIAVVQAANGTLNRGVSYANALSGALANTSCTQFPAGNPLALQLQTVARIIKVRSALGLRGKSFLRTGWIDTHTDSWQLELAAAAIEPGGAAFYRATQELGVDSNVTTFTASEFGRSCSRTAPEPTMLGQPHFVIGPASRAASSMAVPTLALAAITTPPDRRADSHQFGGSIWGHAGQWFGVAPEVSAIFPNIGNFKTSNLGILGSRRGFTENYFPVRTTHLSDTI